MGWEYEVEAFGRAKDDDRLAWRSVYQGNSRRRARRAERRAVMGGAGAVRTTWRPM